MLSDITELNLRWATSKIKPTQIYIYLSNASFRNFATKRKVDMFDNIADGSDTPTWKKFSNNFKLFQFLQKQIYINETLRHTDEIWNIF